MNYPKIKVRSSIIHNRGVFACDNIKRGSQIIEYAGEKITKKESENREKAQLELSSKNSSIGAVYIFELDEMYDIDGSVGGNVSKYINHSCDPNCEVDILDGKILFIAIRDIKAGDELTFNYCYDFGIHVDHPCKCGSKNCVGYILDDSYWPRLKASEEQKKI